MLHRAIGRAMLPLALATVACDGGVGPETEAGNVNAILGAVVVETDSGIVVPGQWRLAVPSNGKALWLDRFLRYDFGGFPELDYPQNTRFSDSWRLQLTHEKARVARNDSTIFSFVDHGEAAVEDSTMQKLTTLPSYHPVSPSDSRIGSATLRRPIHVSSGLPVTPRRFTTHPTTMGWWPVNRSSSGPPARRTRNPLPPRFRRPPWPR